MKDKPAQVAELLRDAECLMSDYLAKMGDLNHEAKGIRRSEMFFFYASVAHLQPTGIIESGRARAQSTLVLSRLFQGAAIVSLESDAASPDVEVAAERLRGCHNVECRFGDSLRLLPEIVRPGDVVLIDGPKDFRALRLAFRLLRGNGAAMVFVHDLWLGSPARRFVDRHLPSVLLSDESAWVERYSSLDSGRPAPASTVGSPRRAYGATFGRFERGACNYHLLDLSCRFAQGRDRLGENGRKFAGRPSLVRPRDFESPGT